MNNETTLRTVPIAEMKKKYSPSYWMAFKDSVVFLLLTSTILILGYKSIHENYNPFFYYLFLVPVLRLLQVKSFLILHDCGHNNYTPNSTLNYFLVFLHGTFILTPPTWSKIHQYHHVNNRNLKQKEHFWSETVFHTKEEFLKINPILRKIYKFFRSPLIFFTLIATANFWIKNPFWSHPKILLEFAIHNSFGDFVLLLAPSIFSIYVYVSSFDRFNCVRSDVISLTTHVQCSICEEFKLELQGCCFDWIFLARNSILL